MPENPLHKCGGCIHFEPILVSFGLESSAQLKTDYTRSGTTYTGKCNAYYFLRDTDTRVQPLEDKILTNTETCHALDDDGNKLRETS